MGNRAGASPALHPLGLLLVLASHNWFGGNPGLREAGFWYGHSQPGPPALGHWTLKAPDNYAAKVSCLCSCLCPCLPAAPSCLGDLGCCSSYCEHNPLFCRGTCFYLQLFRPRVSPTLGSPVPLLWLWCVQS